MKTSLLCTIFLATLSPGVASAATVRGRLVRNVGGRQTPAGGLSVTLLNGRGVRSFAVTSDANGMYYFPTVTQGSYTLQIWPRPGAQPLTRPVQVNEPNTDVNPLILP